MPRRIAREWFRRATVCALMIVVVSVMNYKIPCKRLKLKNNSRGYECKNRNLSYIPWFPNSTTIVNFDGNYLPRVNRSTLRNLTHLVLKILSLANNKIVHIAPDAFEDLHHLEMLNLSKNSNSKKDQFAKAFYGLRKTKITVLVLNYIGICETGGFFNGLNSTNISKIFLNSNKISSYDGRDFQVIGQHLTKLTIESNRIKEIKSWGSLPALSTFVLRDNVIKTLPPFMENNAKFMPNLRCFILSSNRIDFVNSSTFMGLGKLYLLNLTENWLPYLVSNIISELPNLQKLYIGSNRMGSGSKEAKEPIKPSTFNSSSLKVLSISKNSIRFTEKNSFIFNSTTNLESLNMQGNILPSDKYTLNKMFTLLTRLRQLNIADCKLQVAPQVLLFLPKLEDINLRNNEIKTWRPEKLPKNIALKNLNLAANRIATVQEKSFSQRLLNAVEKIDFSSNIFSCTCGLLWFRTWISRNEKKLARYPQKYTCYSPVGMAGKLLKDYYPTTESCQDDGVVVVVSAILGSLLLVALVCGAVGYKYRWHFRYWMLLAQSRRKQYEELTDSNQYTYDVFVCHSRGNDCWVVRDLLPQLEGSGHLRLCLHQRDFMPGRDIVDNIVESIESSRKVVLVLSNDFARSHWCHFEMSLAQNRLLEESRDVLVMVLLEQISPEYRNPRLRLLLRKKTYLEWSDDVMGQKIFWKRLKLALAYDARHVDL